MTAFPATFASWYALTSAWLHAYAGWTLDELPGDLDVWLVYRYFRHHTAQNTAAMLAQVSWGVRYCLEERKGIA